MLSSPWENERTSLKTNKFIILKATSHLTIFMRGLHAKGKVQKDKY